MPLLARVDAAIGEATACHLQWQGTDVGVCMQLCKSFAPTDGLQCHHCWQTPYDKNKPTATVDGCRMRWCSAAISRGRLPLLMAAGDG